MTTISYQSNRKKATRKDFSSQKVSLVLDGGKGLWAKDVVAQIGRSASVDTGGMETHGGGGGMYKKGTPVYPLAEQVFINPEMRL